MMLIICILILSVFLGLLALSCFFMFTIIRYLLTRPLSLSSKLPKPHPFVKIGLKNAIGNTIYSLGVSSFIVNLVWYCAYLFSVGMFLNVFKNHLSCLMIDKLIELLEQIIQNTTNLHTQALGYLNNQNNTLAMLREAHAYLTPYIRSYESIFDLLRRIVIYLINTDSVYATELEDLEEEFRRQGNNLLGVYRLIEREISIGIDESPIPLQRSEIP